MNEYIKNKMNELSNFVKDSTEHQNKELQYVLYSDDNKYRILFSDNNEEAIEFSHLNNDYDYVPDWDYNFDYYIYDYLDNDYKIGFMKDDVHYSLWNSISELWPNDIDCVDGVKYYIKYCNENGINKEYLDKTTGFDTPDIMPMFKDKEIEI